MRVGSQHWQIVPQILSSKYPTQNRAGEVIQVVVLLPNKPEAMNSNLSTIKKKKNSCLPRLFGMEHEGMSRKR
jgi:hypothetical protein